MSAVVELLSLAWWSEGFLEVWHLVWALGYEKLGKEAYAGHAQKWEWQLQK